MGAKTDADAEATTFDPVGRIEPRRFRHTLLFPLALARDAEEGGFRASAAALVKAVADALPHSGPGVWRELDDLAAHCEPELEEHAELSARATANAALGKLYPRLGSEIRARNGWEPADEDAAAERYQETVFFHRFVQRVLYGDDVETKEIRRPRERVPSPPMRVFRRRDITRVTLELESVLRFGSLGEEQDAKKRWNSEVATGRAPKVGSVGRLATRAITLAVETINLHLFEAGIAILAITVSAPRNADGAPEAIVSENGVDRTAKVADFLDLIECFRRLYIPYWVKSAVGDPTRLRLHVWAEGVPCAVTWGNGGASKQSAPSRSEVAKAFVNGFPHGVPELLPWWKMLLPDALIVRGTSKPKQGLPQWRFVADERMTTTTFLSVPDIARLSDGAWARLCFCDKAGDGKPYGSGFLADFDSRHAYDRFRSWGTRFVMCGYNFACAVSESDFADLSEVYMRRHYFQIMLVAQFQAAVLLAFSNWVSEAMERYGDHVADEDARRRLREDLHAIENEFQAFVHRYWFTGVSNQVQPADIYDQMRKLLVLDRWFQEVLTEMETSRAFLRDQEQERTARSAERLSLLAGLGLLAVVPAGILGMNMSVGDKDWLKDVLAVARFLPGAADCASAMRISSITGFAWTSLVTALVAALLWCFLSLARAPERVQPSVGGGATRGLAKVTAWVFWIFAAAAALSLLAPSFGWPLCIKQPVPL